LRRGEKPELGLHLIKECGWRALSTKKKIEKREIEAPGNGVRGN